MANRLFNSVVVLLWVIAMAWLFVAKILPPPGQGQPPSFRAMPDKAIACWRIYWNENPIGWSATRISTVNGGSKEVHSRLMLDEIEFSNFPPLMQQAAKLIFKDFNSMALDAKSRLELDPLAHLSAVESKVVLSLPENASNLFEFDIRGHVENSKLGLTISFGPTRKNIELDVRDDLRLGMEFSNYGSLPGMYVGRKWSMRTIDPFSPMNQGTILIDAEVVRTEPIVSNSSSSGHGEEPIVMTNVLELRQVHETNSDSPESLQSVLWIAEDGTVLRQESMIWGSKIRFERMLDKESIERANWLTTEKGYRRRGTGPEANQYRGNWSRRRFREYPRRGEEQPRISRPEFDDSVMDAE